MDSAFSDLTSYNDDRYWDGGPGRWCRFTPAGYAVIEQATDVLYPQPSPWSVEQARQTLDLVGL